jgi:ribosome maturation protein SDO1
MVEARTSTVRLTIDGDKFEILVKPDPALEYKTGKRTDFSSLLVSDEIYSDANKGSRASSEKLTKHFKTKDTGEIAKQILTRGELALTTDQRRRMVEEKKKQIVQFISRNFVDPKTHLPHPPIRIESAINDVRIIIDPFRRAEDQAKLVIEALRKILPLKSEVAVLTITIPPQFAAQSYSVLKGTGSFKNEQWLSDGSLKAIVEVNAGSKGTLLDRIGSVTKGAAKITET